MESIGGLSSLKYINLGSADLERAGPLALSFNMFPSLLELHLSGCGLVSPPPIVSSINFTLLSTLNLSYNSFNTSIPLWVFNVSSLISLNLQYSSVRGTIKIVKLDSLQELDLSYNEIVGELPLALGNQSNLEMLDLSFNNVNGRIPIAFRYLCKLRTLDLMGKI